MSAGERDAAHPDIDGAHDALEGLVRQMLLVLRGEDALVRKARLSPGALNVFKGVNTLHRVVPVSGPTERLVAIFAFYDRPGVVMTDTDKTGFYGRAA